MATKPIFWHNTVVGKQIEENIQELTQEYWEAGFSIGNNLEKQMHKDFVIRILNRIIGKIEDSRNNGGIIIDYCKKIKAELESEVKNV